MKKQDMEAYLVELDEAFAQAFPSPEPIHVFIVGGACQARWLESAHAQPTIVM